jgi:hypothetical protein
MLKRKVTVCFSIFFLVLVLGWRLDHNIHEKQLTTLILPSSNDGYNVLSAKFAAPVHTHKPFLPREYVRIIHRFSE